MVLELDPESRGILDKLGDGPQPIDKLAATPTSGEALKELAELGAVGREGAPLIPLSQPLSPQSPPPLSTLVLNVTNSCNLSCRYCYEYGDDRLGKKAESAAMTEETARQSVETLIAESGANGKLQLTFFGGETLLNWKVLKPTMEYARRRAAEEGKFIDFALTTNATLLTSEIIQFLADNHVGVMVSIDGPRELQDSMRVFSNGCGSYDLVAPKIKELLRVHRSRPIGARVTLTSAGIDVPGIFRHLTEELGFYEVGFAPVTSSTGQDYAIDGDGLDKVLEQFRQLADDYVRGALEDRYVGFANLSDMLGEIHQGGPPRLMPAERDSVFSEWLPVAKWVFVTGLPARAITISETSRPASTPLNASSIWKRRTSTRGPTVALVGSGACALVVAITKPRFATATGSTRTFTIAIGSGAGRRWGLKSTGRFSTRSRLFSIDSMKGKQYEASRGTQSQGRGVDGMAGGRTRATWLRFRIQPHRTTLPAAPPSSHPVGKSTPRGARRDCASRSSAIFTTVYKTCYWPAQVPDYLNNNPDWHSACASATRDWRKIDLVFP